MKIKKTEVRQLLRASHSNINHVVENGVALCGVTPYQWTARAPWGMACGQCQEQVQICDHDFIPSEHFVPMCVECGKVK